MTKRTFSLDEAAGILGLTKEALRKRIKRGSIVAEKDGSGMWQVILEDADQDGRHDTGQDVSSPVVQAMQSEIDFLRHELERKDHIIMALTQKIPQLEAPKEENQNNQEKDQEKRRRWWPFSRREKK